MERMGSSHNQRKWGSDKTLLPKKNVTELKIKCLFLTFRTENMFLCNDQPN
jgi:hypothetical protein